MSVRVYGAAVERCALAVGATVAAVLCWVTSARADGGVLVFAPHPDDEIVATAGILVHAARAGRDVNVVVVTNGDFFGTDEGLTRQGESVDGLAVLGIPESRVVFLGYPDGGLLPLWNNAPRTTQAYFSPGTGRSTTYGDRGFGLTDFHTVRLGVPGAYNQPTLVDDVRAALDLFRPADVYVTGVYDQHPDHRASYYAVRDALRMAATADASFRPTLHTTIIHDPLDYPFDDFWPADQPREAPVTRGNDDVWPNPSLASGVPDRFEPEATFAMPPSLPLTILDWRARASVPVPHDMTLPTLDDNLKARSAARHATQVSPILWAHVKADEFFWSEPVRLGQYGTNLARIATVTASSAAATSPPAATVDGVVDGAPATEWVAADAGLPAFVQLTWRIPRVIDRIGLFDRVSLTDRVIEGRVVLDDDTTVRFGALANDGRGDELLLPGPPHRVRTLTVYVDRATGTPGLAEVEVFGAQATTCSVDEDCYDGDPCTTDRCVAGQCAVTTAPDGTPCGDDNACNGVEVCRQGVCTREPPPDCDDADPCTADRCEPPAGCTHEAICRPVAARGPGGCLVAFAGVPADPCVDGDPTCDRDGLVNGGCRFDVILCVNDGPTTPTCSARVGLRSLGVGGRWRKNLAGLVDALRARMPSGERSCAGPVALQLTLRGRRTAARVPIRVTTADGRVRRANVRMSCRAAPTARVPHPPRRPHPR